jgi:hypothetical protein
LAIENVFTAATLYIWNNAKGSAAELGLAAAFVSPLWGGLFTSRDLIEAIWLFFIFTHVFTASTLKLRLDHVVVLLSKFSTRTIRVTWRFLPKRDGDTNCSSCPGQYTHHFISISFFLLLFTINLNISPQHWPCTSVHHISTYAFKQSQLIPLRMKQNCTFHHQVVLCIRRDRSNDHISYRSRAKDTNPTL